MQQTIQQGVLSLVYWDSFYASGNNWGQPRPQILAIVDELQRTFGAREIRILELACGNGRYAIPFAELGAQIDGVDFSEVALAQLRARAEERGIGNLIQSHCADVREFLIKPSWYHLVFASGLFEYLGKDELFTLIHDVQAGTVIQGVNAFVWLLQHPEAATIPGEYPLVPGTIEDIYTFSPGWQVISSEAYLKEDYHPLEVNGGPQKHKHYVGRMIAKRTA